MSLWSQWVRVYVHVVLTCWSCMFNALNDDTCTQESGIWMIVENATFFEKHLFCTEKAVAFWEPTCLWHLASHGSCMTTVSCHIANDLLPWTLPGGVLPWRLPRHEARFVQWYNEWKTTEITRTHAQWQAKNLQSQHATRGTDHGIPTTSNNDIDIPTSTYHAWTTTASACQNKSIMWRLRSLLLPHAARKRVTALTLMVSTHLYAQCRSKKDF